MDAQEKYNHLLTALSITIATMSIMDVVTAILGIIALVAAIWSSITNIKKNNAQKDYYKNKSKDEE